MSLSPEIAVLVLLILPGLVGYAWYEKLMPTRLITWPARVVIAILLSVFSYVTVRILHSVFAIIPDPTDHLLAAELSLNQVLSAKSLVIVLLATLIAALYASGCVLLNRSELLNRFARWVKLSDASGYVTHWDDVTLRHRTSNWVTVQLKDGRAYTGFIVTQSVGVQERSLELACVREYDSDGCWFLWPVEHRAFFCNMQDVRLLRFIPRTETHSDETIQKSREAEASLDPEYVQAEDGLPDQNDPFQSVIHPQSGSGAVRLSPNLPSETG